MPGQIRPSRQLAKIVFKQLRIPKDMQQRNDPNPTERRKEQWYLTSSTSA